ncbi:hypothetical protein [Methylocella silvestris]|uniref:Uncharacterized protein n=1 Tax=Methylocella silvestris TaxID=199596 RepID=A0A2J7TD85_METSI|nr:hypothetical protein [Methylocella silvestris]PNG24735.1 hypothetical protein CR492_17190 [Methylocella silvestris]
MGKRNIAFIWALLWSWPVYGACVKPASQDIIDGFAKDPSILLDVYPRGDIGMAAVIQSYAVTGDIALAAIGATVSAANQRQRSAIGAGLAMASQACAGQNPEVPRKITAVMRSVSDPDVLRAYVRGMPAGDAPAELWRHPPAGPTSPPPSKLGVDTTGSIGRRGLALEDPFKPFAPIYKIR